MEVHEIAEVLKSKGVLYIEDDIEEVVVRITYKDGKYCAYGKRHGREEVQSYMEADVVYNAEIQGFQISKERYDNY